MSVPLAPLGTLSNNGFRLFSERCHILTRERDVLRQAKLTASEEERHFSSRLMYAADVHILSATRMSALKNLLVMQRPVGVLENSVNKLLSATAVRKQKSFTIWIL